MKKPKNYLVDIKALAKVMGQDVLPEVKLPQKRKPRKKGMTYKHPEAEFRKRAIKFLRSKGCEVKRLENAITGKNNRYFPDLWVFCLRTKWAGWVELKSMTGQLSHGQRDFQNMCHACGVNHIVAKRLDQLKGIYL